MIGQLEIPDNEQLTAREQVILRSIVHQFILMANPVGSRFLSKHLEVETKLSPATIRNAMADLEAMGYISHPHISAGRVPTDKGYRHYVDSLMNVESLSNEEKISVQSTLTTSSREGVLRDATKILGVLSHSLAVVEMPQILNSIVHKIELYPLSSTRLLVVIHLSSDIVRTISLEANFEANHNQLAELSHQLNERLSGKNLEFIHKNFANIVQDVQTANTALLRLFVDSAEKLFSKHLTTGETLHIAGAPNLFDYPEFGNADRFRSIIELVENKEVIIHLLDSAAPTEGKVNVFIGKEMLPSVMEDYSLLTTRYRFPSSVGTIGLIGPKRMNYAKMISIVQFVAETLSQKQN